MDDRNFQVWEYQVSHQQLLVRSPKAPATGTEPERRTNVDLVFLGVDYMCLPAWFRGLSLDQATPDELQHLGAAMGRIPKLSEVTVLVSAGKRFPVVAASVVVSENDWDCFESPFEFRSHFRGASH